MNPEEQIWRKAKEQGKSDEFIKNAILAYRQSKATPPTQPTAPQESGGIWGFVKNLVSAPVTLLARPFQAASELGSLIGTNIAANEAKNRGDIVAQGAILNQGRQDMTQRQNTPSAGGFVAPIPSDLAGVKKDVGRAIQTVALGAGGFATAGAGIGLGSSLEQGNDLFSIETAVQTALGAGAGKFLGLVGKPLFNVAGKVVGEITPQYLKDIVAKGNQAIVDFAAQHEILPQGVRNVSSAVSSKLSQVGSSTKNAIASEYKGSTLDSVVSGLRNKTAGIFEGKTQAEILATPEAQVYKLSPSERKLYYDAHTSAITERSAQVEAQIKQDLAQRTATLQSEAEALSRKLAVASRDEVIALRPKIRTALGQQSQEYRRLVEEEIAPHKELPVTAQEVGSFVDTKFSEDPAKSLAIKQKLGIVDTTNPQAETTIGQLYDKAKSLGQDISASVKKGTRVYTPDEKLTDDAIHTITDIMKQKGVDLSAARQFWAKYAPIRNQLVTEAKPFLQAPTQTKTFAGTLTRVAKGTDVNNENFIKEVENLLGSKIGAKTRTTVAELSANAKQKVAAEIEAQLQKAEAKLVEERALKNWSDQKFVIEQKAERRKAIINAFKIVGLIIGIREATHIAPFIP